MKRFLLPLIALAGMLQNGPLAGAQASRVVRQSTPIKKSTSARKKVVRRPAAPPKVDPTIGDNVDGEDLSIRRAAVEALGMQPGSVVVVDPNTGRVLTMVNQRLALKSGFIPCSTIKLVTALAALSEHVVATPASI
jgi:penicillin-binding protein 2